MVQREGFQISSRPWFQACALGLILAAIGWLSAPTSAAAETPNSGPPVAIPGSWATNPIDCHMELQLASGSTASDGQVTASVYLYYGACGSYTLNWYLGQTWTAGGQTYTSWSQVPLGSYTYTVRYGLCNAAGSGSGSCVINHNLQDVWVTGSFSGTKQSSGGGTTTSTTTQPPPSGSITPPQTVTVCAGQTATARFYLTANVDSVLRLGGVGGSDLTGRLSANVEYALDRTAGFSTSESYTLVNLSTNGVLATSGLTATQAGCPPLEPTGTISAYPNPCVIRWTATDCRSRVSFSVANPNAAFYPSYTTTAYVLVTGGRYGSTTQTLIGATTSSASAFADSAVATLDEVGPYTFILYGYASGSGQTTTTKELARTTVTTEKRTGPPTGSLTADPNPCQMAPRYYACTTSLTPTFDQTIAPYLKFMPVGGTTTTIALTSSGTPVDYSGVIREGVVIELRDDQNDGFSSTDPTLDYLLATVTVTGLPPVPTIDLTGTAHNGQRTATAMSDGEAAVTLSIHYDRLANLSWSTTWATRCTGAGTGWDGLVWTWDDAFLHVGQPLTTDRLRTDRTYQLDCEGPGGTTLAKLTIVVEAPCDAGREYVTRDEGFENGITGAQAFGWEVNGRAGMSAATNGSVALDADQGNPGNAVYFGGGVGGAIPTTELASYPGNITTEVANTAFDLQFLNRSAGEFRFYLQTHNQTNEGRFIDIPLSDAAYTLGEWYRMTLELDPDNQRYLFFDGLSQTTGDLPPDTIEGTPFVGMVFRTYYSTATAADNFYRLDNVSYSYCQIPPPTVRLTVSDQHDGLVDLPLGEPVLAAWVPTNATRCVASGAWSGDKDAAGGQEVLTDLSSGVVGLIIDCTGPGGRVRDVVRVRRHAPLELTCSAQPTSQLTLASAPVTTEVLLYAYDPNGFRFTGFSWDFADGTAPLAQTNLLEPGTNRLASDGVSRIDRIATHTYTDAGTYQIAVTAETEVGETGTTTCELIVTDGSTPEVVLWLNNSATPAAIPHGGSGYLAWATRHATRCWTSGGNWPNGDRAVQSDPDNPESTGILTGPNTYTYRLTCEGADPGKSASATVNVEVLPPAPKPPLLELRVEPSTIPDASEAFLSWSSQYADRCQASGDWQGSRPAQSTSSESTGTLSGPAVYTYTLTCIGTEIEESVSQTVSVTVDSPISPSVLRRLRGSFVAPRIQINR